MVYECDQCKAVLPAGVAACPRCGECFDETVPADAVLPKTGFHAAAPPPAGLAAEFVITEQEETKEDLIVKLEQAETDITTLQSQAIVLKSEVMTLRGHISTLTSEITILEDHSAALQTHSTLLQSQLTTITNRLTVLELAGREDKRRFMDHVQHVKEALGYIQINGPTGAAGQ